MLIDLRRSAGGEGERVDIVVTEAEDAERILFLLSGSSL